MCGMATALGVIVFAASLLGFRLEPTLARQYSKRHSLSSRLLELSLASCSRSPDGTPTSAVDARGMQAISMMMRKDSQTTHEREGFKFRNYHAFARVL
jgi:hypothetical protein